MTTIGAILFPCIIVTLLWCCLKVGVRGEDRYLPPLYVNAIGLPFTARAFYDFIQEDRDGK